MKYPTKVVPSGFRRLCAFLALVVIFPCASAEVVEGAVGARETVTDGTDGGVYLGLHGGTLGAGPVLGYEFSKRLGVRGQLDWFDYETDSVGDDEYSGNLEFRSGSLLFDWNPFSGAFRFTAGAVANQSEIWAATKDASIDLGGRSYAGTANLQVGFDSVAPYLGFGWSAGRKDGGMRLLLDVGVVFQGTPQISASGSVGESGLGTCSFTLSSEGVATLGGTLCDMASSQSRELEADLAEEHRMLTDDLEPLKMWPLVALGVAYSF